MSQLELSDFAHFFKELHSYDPFPWQTRLARDVCSQGIFPTVLDLPTGSGKTACIDIAIYHLAYTLSRRGVRTAPFRIVWVVDRRIIVDEAYERASEIAHRLQGATSGILARVAAALQLAAGAGAPPLMVSRLRGGMPLEGDWARSPAQPTVVTSTVDQIGSRLLFRGYGVSPRMRPIHAGLLGEDALIVLDEVHLAEPFRQTLSAIENLKVQSHTPWQFVQLSATPRTLDIKEAFSLRDDPIDDRLWRRLSLPKPAKLIDIGRVQYGTAQHAEHFASEALACIHPRGTTPPARTVLVVCNRVALARRIYQSIASKATTPVLENTILLIGRNRGVAKDVLRGKLQRCKSKVIEESGNQHREPFIVVATQCIEAGADLDFDVVITQIASLDALRQRFGRLNRMGRNIEPYGAILAASGEVGAKAKSDVIYGNALRDTWSWLNGRADERGVVDFSSTALCPSAEEAADLSAPRKDAPVLMPAHLQTLTHTQPEPPASPLPALYLHGLEAASADVNIVWRGDLPREAAYVAELLSMVPPRTAEAVTVPIKAARDWLRKKATDETLSDMESTPDATVDESESQLRRSSWRWRGNQNDVVPASARNLAPGDTIVVSSSEAGCDVFGWAPESKEPVSDRADIAAEPYASRTFALRMHPQLLVQLERPSELTSSWSVIASEIDRLRDGGARAKGIICEILQSTGIQLPLHWHNALRRLTNARSVVMEFPYGAGDESAAPGIVFFARHGLVSEGTVQYLASTTEDDTVALQSADDEGESLAQHSANVREVAAKFALSVGLSPALAGDIALAGFLHDAGKADPRFQAYLAGDPFRARRGVRAKSGGRRSRLEDRRAFEASGLPPLWRHEALSVRIARAHEAFGEAHDPELVLWLIGTHHGFGRPAFPHADPHDDCEKSYYGFEPHISPNDSLTIGSSAGPQRLDFQLSVVESDGPLLTDWQTMFHRLQSRYGPWGLAWFESIMRLADHRASDGSLLGAMEVTA